MGKGVKVSFVIKTLRKAGFVKNNKMSNSHGDYYMHSDGRTTTIGRHYKNGVIPNGTMAAIKRQTGLLF